MEDLFVVGFLWKDKKYFGHISGLIYCCSTSFWFSSMFRFVNLPFFTQDSWLLPKLHNEMTAAARRCHFCISSTLRRKANTLVIRSLFVRVRVAVWNHTLSVFHPSNPHRSSVFAFSEGDKPHPVPVFSVAARQSHGWTPETGWVYM